MQSDTIASLRGLGVAAEMQAACSACASNVSVQINQGAGGREGRNGVRTVPRITFDHVQTVSGQLGAVCQRLEGMRGGLPRDGKSPTGAQSEFPWEVESDTSWAYYISSPPT